MVQARQVTDLPQIRRWRGRLRQTLRRPAAQARRGRQVPGHERSLGEHGTRRGATRSGLARPGPLGRARLFRRGAALRGRPAPSAPSAGGSGAAPGVARAKRGPGAGRAGSEAWCAPRGAAASLAKRAVVVGG